MRLRLLLGAAGALLLACGQDEAAAPAKGEPAARVAEQVEEPIAESERAPRRESATLRMPDEAPPEDYDRDDDDAVDEPEAGTFDAHTAITSTDPELRTDAVLDLDPADPADLDLILRAAREDVDVGVREAAVLALGDVEDRRAVDALVIALGDPDRRIVLAAIDALAFSEDTRAMAELDRLAHSPDAEIAAAAQEVIGER